MCLNRTSSMNRLNRVQNRFYTMSYMENYFSGIVESSGTTVFFLAGFPCLLNFPSLSPFCVLLSVKVTLYSHCLLSEHIVPEVTLPDQTPLLVVCNYIN